MDAPTRFLTTAIDYTNGAPHIGHAYEKVLTDVFARYQRLRGRPTYFLTGVDQHGQKVAQSAEKEGISPREFTDRITAQFRAVYDKLGVSYDAWAETTDPRHIRVVQAALQRLFDCGQIYKAAYEGFYSVKQEQFLTDKERGTDGQYGPEWARSCSCVRRTTTLNSRSTKLGLPASWSSIRTRSFRSSGGRT